MTRRGPLLAATAVLAVALTACDPGDNPKPNYSSVTPTASASTSASPTASPSPSVPTTGPNVSPGEVAPTEPAAAAVDDSAGAISFAGYYVKTLDWVFATSAVDILTPFYAANCTTCESRVDYLTGIFANGGHLAGGRLAIDRVQVVTNDGRLGATMAVSTAVSVSAAVVVDGNGSPATSAAASPGITLTTWLKWQESRWVIVEEGYA